MLFFSFSDRELIVKSLVNLGFVFLGAKIALGTRHIAERHWELGNTILLKILKKKHDAASTIIREICEKISYGRNVNITQYTGKGISKKQVTNMLFHAPPT